MKHLKKSSPIIGIMATFFALFLVLAPAAYADGGLTVSTNFPGMTVTAGKTVTFSITLDNTSTVPMNCAISISDLPSGWDAVFTSGGNQVSRVFVRPDSSVNVTLGIDIPSDTPEGNYNVNVNAEAEGIAYDTLQLTLEVGSTDISQGQFNSQFPELQGGAGTSFAFNVDLTNSGGEDMYYSLSAAAEEGWLVTFRPANTTTDIASLTVASGETQGMTITVKPPTDIRAGEYTIPLLATSSTGSLSLDLRVIITGNYEMTLVTSDGRLNADVQVGRETPVTLVIANTGSADLTDVTLASTLPTNGWAIRFDQPTIESLPAGATQEVIAFIQPDARAVTGDYAASITATTPQVSSGIDLRIAVQTSTVWGIVAVVIIVLLAGGLYLVFRKFGRR